MIARYGRDYIADYWRGDVTLRQLRVLVQHLPPDSAAGRAERGHSWTDVNYQLADVFDRVGWLISVTVAAADSKGKSKPKPPEPFPRPDELIKKQRRREKSSASALAYIENYRNRKD